jgi:hypothetical protein
VIFDLNLTGGNLALYFFFFLVGIMGSEGGQRGERSQEHERVGVGVDVDVDVDGGEGNGVFAGPVGGGQGQEEEEAQSPSTRSSFPHSLTQLEAEAEQFLLLGLSLPLPPLPLLAALFSTNQVFLSGNSKTRHRRNGREKRHNFFTSRRRLKNSISVLVCCSLSDLSCSTDGRKRRGSSFIAIALNMILQTGTNERSGKMRGYFARD